MPARPAPPVTSLRQALGRAIRAFRREAGYSQEAFADAVGVHRTFAGTIERGETNLSLDSLARVAASLGLPASALLLAAEGLLESVDGEGVPAVDDAGVAGAPTRAATRPKRPPHTP